MKVKNIMFSGFAAALFAGVCGAASAADYTLASKGFVETQLAKKQNTLTAGSGIDITDDTISADLSTVTVKDAEGKDVNVSSALTNLSTSVAGVEEKLGELPAGTTVAGALAGKQDTLSNAEVLEEITSEDVASIGTTASAVETLSGTVGTITNAEGTASTVAAEISALRTGVADADAAAEGAAAAAGEAQADVDALTLVVNQNTTNITNKLDKSVYEQHLTDQAAKDKAQDDLIDGLSGITGDGGSLSQLQTTVTKLDGDANVSGSVANQIAAAISAEELRADGKYQEKGDYVETSTLTEYQGTVTNALAGKQDTIENLNTIVAGAAKGATAVQPGDNVSTLTNDSGFQTETQVKSTIEGYGYQTAAQVEAEIAGATIAESQVSGLTQALAAKANTADVNTALDGKLDDTMTAAGTYLVKRAENGDISYVSVEIVGAAE